MHVQVRDVTLQNEYNMRLKDVAMEERIKELTEKHAVESQAQKEKYELLQQEKAQQESKHELQLRESAERQQASSETRY
jgi:hypothetical protein